MSHLRALHVIALALAAEQAAGAVNGDGIDLKNYSGEAILSLNFGDLAGDHNLAVKVQHSADDGATDAYADAGVAFDTQTGTGDVVNLHVNVDQFKRYIRVVSTVAGTSTPVATFAVNLVAKADRT